jgi:hypothetical protein
MIAKLRCPKCGVTQDAACGCGVDYQIVRPIAAAMKAVEAHPEKSDRAIAAEVGVSDRTVNRARQRTTATNVAVEKRTGLDGKARKQPTKQPNAKAAPVPASQAKAAARSSTHCGSRISGNLNMRHESRNDGGAAGGRDSGTDR